MCPDLVDEWHTSKNGSLQPANVVAGSEKKVWWQCRRNPLHVWRTSVAHRTQRGQGCRRCNRIQSEPEIVLMCELEQFFGSIDHDDRRVIDLEGHSWEVDAKIPSEKLVIEYDGHYYHKGEEARDRQKTEAICRAGWIVVRIREVGLGLIQEHDISVEQPYADDVRTRKKKLKKMVDTVLQRLQFILEKDLPSIDHYLERPDLSNYDKARRYLSKLPKLTNSESGQPSGGQQLILFS